MEMKEFMENLDGIIDDSLREPPDNIFPDDFTDKLVKKLEKQLAWQELLTEFGLKTGLVLLALIVMGICLIFPAKTDPAPLIQWVAGHRLIVCGSIGVGLFTFVFDQVVLKYMLKRSRQQF
ncbi:MAG: hypothetical protein NTW31_12015 [Bacteroidetes bacterium]|nr:hypothetical protein [Bacteroidota bacterium]